jgi:hypothetical protein
MARTRADALSMLMGAGAAGAAVWAKGPADCWTTDAESGPKVSTRGVAADGADGPAASVHAWVDINVAALSSREG